MPTIEDEREWLIERIEQLEETNMSLEKRTYAAPHVWNLVAKEIRTQYSKLYSDQAWESQYPGQASIRQLQRRTLENLALSFAHRFNEDEGFDPVTWLDKCSPDTERYPFSELWQEE